MNPTDPTTLPGKVFGPPTSAFTQDTLNNAAGALLTTTQAFLAVAALMVIVWIVIAAAFARGRKGLKLASGLVLVGVFIIGTQQPQLVYGFWDFIGVKIARGS